MAKVHPVKGEQCTALFKRVCLKEQAYPDGFCQMTIASWLMIVTDTKVVDALRDRCSIGNTGSPGVAYSAPEIIPLT